MRFKIALIIFTVLTLMAIGVSYFIKFNDLNSIDGYNDKRCSIISNAIIPMKHNENLNLKLSDDVTVKEINFRIQRFSIILDMKAENCFCQNFDILLEFYSKGEIIETKVVHYDFINLNHLHEICLDRNFYADGVRIKSITYDTITASNYRCSDLIPCNQITVNWKLAAGVFRLSNNHVRVMGIFTKTSKYYLYLYRSNKDIIDVISVNTPTVNIDKYIDYGVAYYSILAREM